MGGIKMKEFNLDEFKKNLNQKVVTRDGRSVRIVCTDAKNEFPIIALITNDDKEVLMDYNNNGKVSPDEMTDLDLFFEPNIKKGWINIFKDNNGTYTSISIYQTKDEAEEVGKESNYYISTHKIEWEE